MELAKTERNVCTSRQEAPGKHYSERKTSQDNVDIFRSLHEVQYWLTILHLSKPLHHPSMQFKMTFTYPAACTSVTYQWGENTRAEAGRAPFKHVKLESRARLQELRVRLASRATGRKKIAIQLRLWLIALSSNSISSQNHAVGLSIGKIAQIQMPKFFVDSFHLTLVSQKSVPRARSQKNSKF